MTATALGFDGWGSLLIDWGWKSTLLLMVIACADRIWLRKKPLVADAAWFGGLMVLLLLPAVLFLSPAWGEWRVSLTSFHETRHATTMQFDTRQGEPGVSDELPPAGQDRVDGKSGGSGRASRSAMLDRLSAKDLVAMAVIVYAVVGLLLGLRLAVGLVLVWRHARAATPIESTTWANTLERHRRALGIRRPVSLRWSDRAAVPATLGGRRPAILLPADLRSLSDTVAIDAILLHELVHVARFDYLAQIAWRLCRCVYWWNPLMWYAERRTAELREVIADGCCVSMLGARDAYVGLLLDIAKRVAARRDPPLAVTMARGCRLERRLAQLLLTSVTMPRARTGHRLGMLAMGAVLLMAAGIVQGTSVAAPPGSKEADDAAPAASSTDEPDLPGSLSGTLNVDSSGGTLNVQVESKDTAAAPELLYLSWQERGRTASGQSTPHRLWDRKGNYLSEQQAADVLSKVKSLVSHWRRENELSPLSLVFKVDRRLKLSPVTATVITADGRRHTGGTARTGPTDGLNVSAAAPNKHSLAEWPREIGLEISYPIEDPQVIRVIPQITEELADPVTLAPGVTWYIDPERAMEFSDRKKPDGSLIYQAPAPARGKLAAVLQRKQGPSGLVSYRPRVLLKDGRELREAYVTIVERQGVPYEIRVSEPFASKNDIARVEFERQRFRRATIEHVPVKIDDEPGP